MATMAGEALFVDTNVLVYASRQRSGFHARAIAGLGRYADAGAPLWVSRQVIREYLAVVTRPQLGEAALSGADAVMDVERFLAVFNVAEDGPGVTEVLLRLLAETLVGGKQVHDLNIVATMVAHRISRLVTFNEGDFGRFGGMIEVIVP